MGSIGKKRRESFSLDERVNVERLLRTTDLSMRDIAKRIRCDPSMIEDVNRLKGVRFYCDDGKIEGFKKKWNVSGDGDTVAYFLASVLASHLFYDTLQNYF